MNEEETAPLETALDRIANGNNLLLLKALLPYMEMSMQKYLAVYIKFMELENVQNFYAHTSDMSACGLMEVKHEPSDMLKDIRRFTRGAQRDMIDKCMQMTEMMGIFQVMSSMDSPEDMLNNILSPEQKEMFQMYETMFAQGGEGEENGSGGMDTEFETKGD